MERNGRGHCARRCDVQPVAAELQKLLLGISKGRKFLRLVGVKVKRIDRGLPFAVPLQRVFVAQVQVDIPRRPFRRRRLRVARGRRRRLRCGAGGGWLGRLLLRRAGLGGKGSLFLRRGAGFARLCSGLRGILIRRAALRAGGGLLDKYKDFTVA